MAQQKRSRIDRIANNSGEKLRPYALSRSDGDRAVAPKVRTGSFDAVGSPIYIIMVTGRETAVPATRGKTLTMEHQEWPRIGELHGRTTSGDGKSGTRRSHGGRAGGAMAAALGHFYPELQAVARETQRAALLPRPQTETGRNGRIGECRRFASAAGKTATVDHMGVGGAGGMSRCQQEENLLW